MLIDRTKKRKFRGNQHTAEQSTEFALISAKKFLENKELGVTISSNFTCCNLEFATVFFTISSVVVTVLNRRIFEALVSKYV